VNVSISNVMLDESANAITYELYNRRIEWPGGVCCLANQNSTLQITSSSFVNISSHCLGFNSSRLSIKDTIFDNSQLYHENSVLNHQLANELDEYSGATWINLQGISETFEDGNQIVLVGNKFIRNQRVPLYGGALRFNQNFSGQAYIAFNEFTGNTAYYGGAIYSQSPLLTLILNGNQFSGNRALDGGSLYKISYEGKEKMMSNASVILYNNTFDQNEAQRDGGAILLKWESLWSKNNSFVSNKAQNGGAIYFTSLDENRKIFGWLMLSNSILTMLSSMKIKNLQQSMKEIMIQKRQSLLARSHHIICSLSSTSS